VKVMRVKAWSSAEHVRLLSSSFFFTAVDDDDVRSAMVERSESAA
jgi:hypothetical protein